MLCMPIRSKMYPKTCVEGLCLLLQVDRPHCFVVRTTSTFFYVKADTEKDMEEWIQAITKLKISPRPNSPVKVCHHSVMSDVRCRTMTASAYANSGPLRQVLVRRFKRMYSHRPARISIGLYKIMCDGCESRTWCVSRDDCCTAHTECG